MYGLNSCQEQQVSGSPTHVCYALGCLPGQQPVVCCRVVSCSLCLFIV